MAFSGRNIMDFGRDEDGQATLEWTLILVGFILPMVAVLNLLLNILVAHYRIVTYIETLPFP